MNEYDQLWQQILNDLENIFSEELYIDVFDPLKKTHKFSNGQVYVLVPNEFIKIESIASTLIK